MLKLLLAKEMKLTASALSYLFIALALLAFCPGYPILLGAFFVCLGIFQTFRSAREANDIVYSALLPVPKSSVVRGKFAFCVLIELCGFAVSAIATVVRMTALADAPAYRANALMNANPAFLGFMLLIFALFNAIFVRGFFKTAREFTKPFIGFIIATLVTIFVAEGLHHVPGLKAVNAFGFEHIGLQLAILAGGAALFILLTLLSERSAMRRFEALDL
jgi:hypothetical protein